MEAVRDAGAQRPEPPARPVQRPGEPAAEHRQGQQSRQTPPYGERRALCPETGAAGAWHRHRLLRLRLAVETGVTGSARTAALGPGQGARRETR